MGRCFKGPLHSLQKEKKKKGDLDENVQVLPQFKVNDAVFVRNYGNGEFWVPGKTAEVFGVRNYKVQLQGYGNLYWRRHADQIMPRYLDRQEVIDKPLFPYMELGSVSRSDSHPEKVEVQEECTEIDSSVYSDVQSDTVVSREQVTITSPPRSPSVGTENRTASGRVVKPPVQLNL